MKKDPRNHRLLSETQEYVEDLKSKLIKANKQIEQLKKYLFEVKNAVEYIDEDGNRFVWSESNCHYEQVEPDAGLFTLLISRLEKAEIDIKQLSDLNKTRFKMLKESQQAIDEISGDYEDVRIREERLKADYAVMLDQLRRMEWYYTSDNDRDSQIKYWKDLYIGLLQRFQLLPRYDDNGEHFISGRDSCFCINNKGKIIKILHPDYYKKDKEKTQNWHSGFNNDGLFSTYEAAKEAINKYPEDDDTWRQKRD